MNLKWAVLLVLVAGTMMSGCAEPPADTVHEVIYYKGDQALGGGSGVMVAPYLMLTAAHLVQAEEANGATLMVGPNKAPARVLRVDPDKDLALLYVAIGCPCAAVGEAPAVGDEVTEIGFPMFGTLGLKVTTEGKANGVSRTKVITDGFSPNGRLLYTAPSAPGNSGGGIFVRTWLGWRLVGITSAMAALHLGWVSVPVTHLAMAATVEDINEFLNSWSEAELALIKGAA